MVSSLLLLLGVVWSRLRTDRKRRLAYSTMMADPAAVQGRKLEFYDDRIESVSARGTSVIPFAYVTAYIETMRVIALVSGDRCIYIRGQDLTAYDAGLIRSFLRTRVPALSLIHIWDKVEPRREFIERNAKYVSNLDI